MQLELSGFEKYKRADLIFLSETLPKIKPWLEQLESFRSVQKDFPELWEFYLSLTTKELDAFGIASIEYDDEKDQIPALLSEIVIDALDPERWLKIIAIATLNYGSLGPDLNNIPDFLSVIYIFGKDCAEGDPNFFATIEAGLREIERSDSESTS